MATLKIISDSDCHVFIDMELKCDIKANTLCKLSLNKGSYIIDCVHINQIDRVSLDYNIDEENTEYLLRVNLNNIYLQRINEYRECSDSPFTFENLKCAQKITTQLYGIIDDKYNEIVPFQYNGIRFCESHVCVSIGDKCGIIDLQNNTLIPIQYGSICFCGNYVCVSIGNQYGVIDLQNNVIIPIQYDEIDCIGNGIFFIKNKIGWGAKSIDGHEIPCIYHSMISSNAENQIYAKNQNGYCGVIDLNNNIIIPFEYSEIEFDNWMSLNDCYIVKDKNGLFGVIDKKTGNPIIPCRYSFLKSVDDNTYKVCYNDEWGALTSRGERIIKIVRYDGENTSFEEDYMIPSKYDWSEHDRLDERYCQTLIVEANGKYGLINIDKVEILPCIYDYLGYETEDGVIPCNLHGQWGYITRTGQFVTGFAYHESKQIANNRILITIWGPKRIGDLCAILDENGREISSPQHYDLLLDFGSNGWAWAKLQGKYGRIDTNGKVCIPFQYEDIKYSNDLIAVKKQGKWGYINALGEIVLPFRYDQAGCFKDNGLAEVEIKRAKGLIDKFGHFIVRKNDSDIWLKVTGDYDIVCDFHNNWALACKDGLWGFINSQGQIIIPFEYEEIFYPVDGLIRCKKNGLWGFIDKQGKIVVPFIYEDISEYKEDLSACKKKGAWGFIDKRGNTIIPFKFEWASSFHNGYAKIGAEFTYPSWSEPLWEITSQNINNEEKIEYANTGMRIGFINKQGQTIIEPTYGSISDFSENGIATVYSEDSDYVDPYDDRYPYYINTANEKITIPK